MIFTWALEDPGSGLEGLWSWAYKFDFSIVAQCLGSILNALDLAALACFDFSELGLGSLAAWKLAFQVQGLHGGPQHR